MEKTNFKKWGWWALGGVVAVIAVALGLALATSGPKPAEDPVAETPVNVAEEAPEETDEEAPVVAEETGSLPQSGPVEDGVLVVLLAGVLAYVMSFAVGNVVRAARAEK